MSPSIASIAALFLNNNTTFKFWHKFWKKSALFPDDSVLVTEKRRKRIKKKESTYQWHPNASFIPNGTPNSISNFMRY